MEKLWVPPETNCNIKAYQNGECVPNHVYNTRSISYRRCM
jgi:hypothetical protein